MKKRFLAAVLMIVMLLGLLPATALAAGSESITVAPFANYPEYANTYDGGSSSQNYTVAQGSNAAVFSVLPAQSGYIPDIYYYQVRTIKDPSGILDGNISVYAGTFPSGKYAGNPCAKIDVPVKTNISGTASITVRLIFNYNNGNGKWYYHDYTYNVTVNGSSTMPTIPVEWDKEHELYIPVGYSYEMEFYLTYGYNLIQPNNLQSISANENIATVKSKLDGYYVDSTIKGISAGDVDVYVTYGASSYAKTIVEKISVHVYDPYTMEVELGTTDDFIHAISSANGTAIKADNIVVEENPTVIDGTDYITVSQYGNSNSWTVTSENTGAVAWTVSGNKVGTGTVKSVFGYLEDKGDWDAIHAFVDVVNVTVKDTSNPETPYTITDFSKDIVRSEDDVEVENLTAETTVTYPGASSTVKIPYDGSVTLLYKLTVTGDTGASFVITDEDATLVDSNCSAEQNADDQTISGTIPAGGSAIIYVTKTFTDATDGKLTNSATIEAGEGSKLDENVTSTPSVSIDGEKGSAPQYTYTLTYNLNTTDKVENMPNPNPDTHTGTEVEYVFTISNAEPTREGYTFQGWADSATATTVGYQAGDKITLLMSSPTKTIYAVWEEVRPQAPSATDLSDIKVIVDCVNDEVNHESGQYGLISGGYEIGEVQSIGTGGYTCAVTLKADAYLAEYNKVINGHSLVEGTTNRKITLTWDAKEKTWTVPATDSVTFTVKCDTPTPETKSINVVFRTNQPWESEDGIIESRKINETYGEFPAPVAPEKEGYKFIGWTSEYDVATSLYEGKFEYNAMLKAGLFNAESDESVTFYAFYKQDEEPTPEPKSINVVFRTNQPWESEDGIIESRKINETYGEFPAPVAPEKEGYKFIGWTSEYDVATSLYEGKFEYNAMLKAGLFNAESDESVTFYAFYKQDEEPTPEPKTITVVFRDGRYDVTDADGVVSARTIDETDTMFPAPTAEVMPEKDGYTFKGWSWESTEDGTNGDASQMLVATDFSYVGMVRHWPFYWPHGPENRGPGG